MHEWSSTIITGRKCHCCDSAGESIIIVGQRRATLCDDCRNKLHAWLLEGVAFRKCREHEAYREYLDGQIAIGQCVSAEQWKGCYAEQHRLEDDLFHLTGRWLEENKRAEEKNEPLADDQL